MTGKTIIILSALFLAAAGFLLYAGALSKLATLSIICFALLIAGMLYLLRGGESAGRKALAVLLFILSLGFLGLFVWEEIKVVKSGGPKIDVAALHLEVFEPIRAELFAKALLNIAPGSKALLLKGWDSSNEAIVKAQIERMKQVFGSDIVIVAEEQLPVVLMNKYGPPRYGLGKATPASAFNDLIAKHKECNLVISMVGLPKEHWKVTVWKWNAVARPQMAFLEGDQRLLESLARKGLICLFSTYKYGWTFNSTVPQDPVKAFNMRYALYDKNGILRLQTQEAKNNTLVP